MSKTIDERVVEMRFDNKQFESNVKTSMSTLDKLKEKLNFKGASKGLENINAAAKNVNMSGLQNGIETVRAKFSALEVVGVTALANIANSAVNAGKRLINAFTFEPIISGFQEYETQINSVQTILANTAHEGTNLEQVNAVLDELNHYADQTIYNFTEMTRNIGTFTAAGVGLEESASAIKGIANLAAMSGSNSQQASSAMYQLSQALAAGRVTLQDWNSVVNAGMGGKVFQDALMRTAEAMGIVVDRSVSFRESISAAGGGDSWLTSDVLVNTLKQFTGDLKDAELAAMGFTEAQIKDIKMMAKNANEAATKVKTFTQLMDTLKEAAQSGWTQTWEIIIGDFEEAKELFTKISDSVSAFLNKTADNRNKVLEGALGSKWDTFIKKVNDAGVSTDDFKTKLAETAKELNGIDLNKLIEEHGSLANVMKKGLIPAKTIIETLKKLGGVGKEASSATEDMNAKLEKFQKIVDDVWRGDYGNGEERVKRLTEAGWKYAEVQDLVNKTVDGHRLKIEDLSDAQLKNIGYTDEQVSKIRELAKEAEKTGTPINELIADISKPSGRELLIDSFSNALQGIKRAIDSVKKAWTDIFPPISIEEKQEKLYKFLEILNKLSEKMVMSAETSQKLVRTFKGVFALIDIIATITGGVLKPILQAIGKLLGAVDLDILSVTAAIGDAIVKVRDWIDAHNIFAKSIEIVLSYLGKAVKGIKDWIDGLKESDNIPRDIILGIFNGLKSGIGMIVSAAKDIAQTIIQTIKDILGIHSPSTVMMEVGKNVILGLVEGLKTEITILINTIKTIGSKISEFFEQLDLKGKLSKTGDNVSEVFEKIGNTISKVVSFVKKIDFGAVLSAGIGIGMTAGLFKISKALEAFSAPLEGVGDMLSGIGKMFEGAGDALEGLGKRLKAEAWKKKAESVLILAAAIVVLATGVGLLAKIKTKDLVKAVVAIGALAAILVGLCAALTLFNKVSITITKSSSAIVKIALALLILAGAMKILTTIKSEEVETTLTLLSNMLIGLGLLMLALSVAAWIAGPRDIKKVSKSLKEATIAIGLMALVIKLMSKLKDNEVKRGITVIGIVGGIFAALILVSKLAGQNGDKAGKMISKMAFAMLAMVAVIKLASMLSLGEVKRGLAVVVAIGLVFSALIAVSALAGQNAAKAGLMLGLMSGAFLAMALVIRIVASLDTNGIKKGIAAITAIGAVFAGLIAVSKFAGKYAIRAGVMLVSMSAAMLLLTGIIFLISKMDPDGLKRGVIVVSILEVLFAGLIVASHWAADCKSTMIGMAIVIGIMVTAVAALTILDPKKLYGATACLAILISSFALLVYASKSLRRISDLGKKLVPLVGVILVLSGIVYLLSELETKSVLGAAGSIAILLLSLSGSLVIVSKAGTVANGAMKTMYLLSGVVAILAIIIGVMSYLNVEASLKNVLALSIFINAMAASLLILSKVGNTATSAMPAMYALSGVIAILGVILGVMSYFDVEASIKTVISLGILINAMAASLLILSKVGNTAISAMPAMYALSGVVALLGIILGLMSYFDVEPSIKTAISLSILLNAMSAALVILGIIGTMGPAAFVGIGALATLIAGIGGLVVAIGALVDQFPQLETFLNVGIPIIEKIGNAIGSFFGNVVGGFQEGVADSLPRIGTTLSEFMENATPFIEGAKNIDATAMDGVKSLVEALTILTGGAIVNQLTSFMDFLTGENSIEDFTSKLPLLGQGLSSFSASVTGVDAENVTAATDALKSLVQVAKDIPNAGGLIAELTGDNPMDVFGTQLPILGQGLSAFSLAVANVDQESVTAAVSALKTLIEVARDIPNSGGLVAELVGDNTLDVFGTQLPILGRGLATFSLIVASVDSKSVEAAAKCLKALAKVAQDIPNTGGLIADLLGDNTVDVFGTQLPALGRGLSTFSLVVASVDSKCVSEAANSVVALAEAADKIPNSGGWVSALTGDNEVDDFGTKLPKLGEGIAKFSLYAMMISPDAITKSIDAIKALANLAEYLDEHDNYEDIEPFPVELYTLGQDIKTYCAYVKDVTVEPINNSVNAIKAIVKMVEYLKDKDYSSLTSLPNGLGSLGKKLKEFASSVAGIDTAQAINATSAIKQILNVVSKMSSTNYSGIAKFNAQLKTISKTSVDTFINAFKGADSKALNAGKTFISSLAKGIKNGMPDVTKLAEPIVNNFLRRVKNKYSDFVTAGNVLMDKLGQGITQKKSEVSNAFTSAISSAVASIRGKYSDMYSAGSYLGSGLVSGINAKQTEAYNAGYKLGQLAAQGEKDGQQSNSPSKLTIQNGKWLGEGLVIGIEQMNRKVYKSGYNMGEMATTTITNAVSRIADAINTDIDAQPTIRPVVDLSDVRSGANTIGDLFNMNPSINTLSNVGAIDSMMNQRIQNGVNNDIISAINKLRKDLSKVGSTTNIIEGITYDDGSNINNAVQELVRAARVERRM